MTGLTFRDVFEHLERTNPDALGLTIGDPIVRASITEVDRQLEPRHHLPEFGRDYICPSCDAGFFNASSLFCHLLDCWMFRGRVG